MSGGRGRTAKTRSANDRLLKMEGANRRKELDPQGLLTNAAVRDFIDAAICPFCGAGPFTTLSGHTNRAHGVDRHELRQWAGLLEKDPISSLAYREACRARALESNAAESIINYQKSENGARQKQRTAPSARARAAMSANITAVNARLTAEERSQRAREWSAAMPEESRKKQGESLRKWIEDNPDVAAARLATMREARSTPEAHANWLAAQERRRKGHGTTASYKRGCRCDACREAKRQSR